MVHIIFFIKVDELSQALSVFYKITHELEKYQQNHFFKSINCNFVSTAVDYWLDQWMCNLYFSKIMVCPTPKYDYKNEWKMFIIIQTKVLLPQV
jgi:hypothetical protein